MFMQENILVIDKTTDLAFVVLAKNQFGFLAIPCTMRQVGPHTFCYLYRVGESLRWMQVVKFEDWPAYPHSGGGASEIILLPQDQAKARPGYSVARRIVHSPAVEC